MCCGLGVSSYVLQSAAVGGSTYCNINQKFSCLFLRLVRTCLELCRESWPVVRLAHKKCNNFPMISLSVVLAQAASSSVAASENGPAKTW